MKKEDIIWLAGLLEGEGCFNYRPERKQARVSIEMTDCDVVTRVAKLFNTSVSVRQPRLTGRCSYCEKTARNCPLSGEAFDPKRFGFSLTKPSYQTAIHGERARNLMRILYPLMGDRRAVKIIEILGDLL